MDPFDTYATAANVAAGMTTEQAATATADTYGDPVVITKEEATQAWDEMGRIMTDARWRGLTDAELARIEELDQLLEAYGTQEGK